MRRFILLAAVVVGTAGAATSAPQELAAPVLVTKLSDPSEKVRNEASAALKGRADALPWLRRAARSRDPITSARANLLLAPQEKKRQQAVAKAIDACLRDGRVDLLTEWHQYWQPEKEDDLWAVGPRVAKPGMDLLAKTCRPAVWKRFQEDLALLDKIDPSTRRSHDGPCPARFEDVDGGWTIRTDRLFHPPSFVRFASVGDRGSLLSRRGGQFLVLGRVGASTIDRAFVACDGDVSHKHINKEGRPALELGVTTATSFVVCRGKYAAAHVGDSVLLVDGDVDLTRAARIRDSLIRASGEIKLPKGAKPLNCDIKARVKDATAPYKFFELADVGLSVAVTEKGVAVTAVTAGTPFGNCGIQKGDLIRSIDDLPAGNSEEFRKKVRRALVRQGDCLVTVVRGEKTIDLPIFFPLPK